MGDDGEGVGMALAEGTTADGERVGVTIIVLKKVLVITTVGSFGPRENVLGKMIEGLAAEEEAGEDGEEATAEEGEMMADRVGVTMIVLKKVLVITKVGSFGPRENVLGRMIEGPAADEEAGEDCEELRTTLLNVDGTPGIEKNVGTPGVETGGNTADGREEKAGFEADGNVGTPGVENGGKITEGVEKAGFEADGNVGTPGVEKAGVETDGNAGTLGVEGLDIEGTGADGNVGRPGVENEGIPFEGFVGMEGIDDGAPGAEMEGMTNEDIEAEGMDCVGAPGVEITGVDGAGADGIGIEIDGITTEDDGAPGFEITAEDLENEGMDGEGAPGVENAGVDSEGIDGEGIEKEGNTADGVGTAGVENEGNTAEGVGMDGMESELDGSLGVEMVGTEGPEGTERVEMAGAEDAGNEIGGIGITTEGKGDPALDDEDELAIEEARLDEGQELTLTVLVEVVGCGITTVLWRVIGFPLTIAVVVAAGGGDAVTNTRGTVTVAVDVVVAMTAAGAAPKLATKGLGGVSPASLYLMVRGPSGMSVTNAAGQTILVKSSPRMLGM